MSGIREIPINWAQGSQVASNCVVLSNKELTIFSCSIIHEIFLFMDNRDTGDFFHALAIVNLVPVNINRINLWVILETCGKNPFSKAIAGVWEIAQPVTFHMMWKTLFQNPRILGHSHHMWIIEPIPWQPLKHKGEVEGNIAANLVGTKYHLMNISTLAVHNAESEDRISYPGRHLGPYPGRKTPPLLTAFTLSPIETEYPIFFIVWDHHWEEYHLITLLSLWAVWKMYEEFRDCHFS